MVQGPKAKSRRLHIRHIFGITPDGPHHDPAPSLAVELPRWFRNFFTKSYIFSQTAMLPNDLYDPHLWYIPLQFQASVIAYIILLCMSSFCRYPASVRIWSMIAVTIYFGCFVNSYVQEYLTQSEEFKIFADNYLLHAKVLLRSHHFWDANLRHRLAFG